MSRAALTSLFVLIQSAALAQSAAPPRPADGRTDTRAAVRGNTRFAGDLYKHTSAARKGNLIVSPFSLSSALAMTSAGAKGQTLAQMEKTLHLPPQRALHPAMRRLTKQVRGAGGVELSVANALWSQKGLRLRDAFRSLLEDDYDASPVEVDFIRDAEASRERINRWVEERTEGHIRDLLPRGVVKEDTRLVLTNAVHFRGRWETPFKEDATSVKPFRLGKGKTRDVHLMRQREAVRYHEHKTFQAVELPYVGGDVSMLVLLPAEGEELASVERLLTPESLEQLGQDLKRQRVEVQLPRFKMATELSLAKTLAEMGMPLLFSDVADLANIAGAAEKLALNEVAHKAFIDVHEKGTDAAAASGALIGSRSIEIVPVFKADRPFVFAIRDNRSGTVLFLGRVSDPAAGQ